MAIQLAHCHISSKGITQRATRSLTSKQTLLCLQQFSHLLTQRQTISYVKVTEQKITEYVEFFNYK